MQAIEIAAGFGFLEGPRFRDGFIYTADHQRCEVFRIDVATGVTETLCHVPNQPSGLAFAADGSLLITSMLDRRVLRLADGMLDEYANLADVCSYPINDITIDSQSRLYIGAFGGEPWIDWSIKPTPVTRVDLDGSTHVVNMDMGWPNGMVFSHDGTRFYAADTFGCRLGIFDVQPDGSLTLVDFFRFTAQPFDNIGPAAESDAFLPDGIAIDGGGRIWIADAHSPSVAIYEPTTHLAAVVTIDALGGNVYALAISPEDEVYACVAPRMNTWTQGVDFPGRLVHFATRACDVRDHELTWQASL